MTRARRRRWLQAGLATAIALAVAAGTVTVLGSKEEVPPLPAPARSLDAGEVRACAVVDAGDVVCWGSLWSEFGGGTYRPERVVAGDFRTVRMGDTAVCATDSEERVWCWKFHNAPEREVRPHLIPGLRGAEDLSVSTWQVCGRDAADRLACADLDADGEAIRSPAPIDWVAEPRQASIGRMLMCVLSDDGRVTCVGQGPGSGPGTHGAVVTPDGEYLDDVVAIDSSNGLSGCAVRRDGTVWCWGILVPGASRSDWLVADPVVGVDSATMVAIGDDHACAVIHDGTVRCWGVNRDGQLGGVSAEIRTDAVEVDGLEDVVELAIWEHSNYARHADGTVSVWGNNGWGELGAASTRDAITRPEQLPEFVPR